MPLPQEVLLDVTFPVDVVCLPVHLGAWNTQLGSWRSVRREGNQLVLCPVRTDTFAVCFGLRIVASLCSCSASSAQSTQLFYSSKTRRSLHALPPQPEHAGASQCSSTRSPTDVVWHWTLCVDAWASAYVLCCAEWGFAASVATTRFWPSRRLHTTLIPWTLQTPPICATDQTGIKGGQRKESVLTVFVAWWYRCVNCV